MYAELEDLVESMRSIEPAQNEEGEPLALEILAPLSAEQKAGFVEACGGKMPAELDALLSMTAGLRGLINFEPEPFFLEQNFIGTLRAYDYGNGDGLGLEPRGDRCRVWWVGHDPYFIVFHAASIAELLRGWLAKVRSAGDGAAPWESADLFFAPENDSAAVFKSGVRSGDDAELAAFLDRLPDDALVHDLRQCPPRTEIPFERLAGLARGGELRRHGLVFAFLLPRSLESVAPLPVAHYLAGDLTEDERMLLASLPRGCMVLHQRDLPEGSKMDTAAAHPEQDVSWKPPFHILYPRRRPWWKLW